MMKVIRISLMLLALIMRSGQEPSCDLNDDNCGESELKSVMLQAAKELEENPGMTEAVRNHENESKTEVDIDEVVRDHENETKTEVDIDIDEEVTGEYEPCERRRMEGQLYRSLMLTGGYILEAEAGMVRVHCQPRKVQWHCMLRIYEFQQ